MARNSDDYDPYGEEEPPKKRPAYPAPPTDPAAVPSPVAGTPPASAGPVDWTTGPWDANRVRSYFQSRNTTPRDTTPKYFEDKWNEWGKDDPMFFFSRLQDAEEFRPAGGGGSGPNIANTGNPLGNYTTDPFVRPVTTQGAATAGGSSGADAGLLYQYLMGRARQSLNVDPNDPIIKGQTDAFRAEQIRAGRRQVRDAAQRGGAYGNAAVRTEERMINEKTGQAVSTYQAQLLAGELQAKRQEVLEALTLAQRAGATQQELALREELAQIEDAMHEWTTRQTLGAGESQFRRNLAQRGYEYDTTQDYLYSPASRA